MESKSDWSRFFGKNRSLSNKLQASAEPYSLKQQWGSKIVSRTSMKGDSILKDFQKFVLSISMSSWTCSKFGPVSLLSNQTWNDEMRRHKKWRTCFICCVIVDKMMVWLDYWIMEERRGGERRKKRINEVNSYRNFQGLPKVFERFEASLLIEGRKLESGSIFKPMNFSPYHEIHGLKEREKSSIFWQPHKKRQGKTSKFFSLLLYYRILIPFHS